ncbi:hypothetical protein [Terrarubrum flagellatum]|uniref:hypothetical protein n=1 Tax=Terrirubrum flagellatum TaxID=2895980 RepID=UPI0031454A0A
MALGIVFSAIAGVAFAQAPSRGHQPATPRKAVASQPAAVDPDVVAKTADETRIAAPAMTPPHNSGERKVRVILSSPYGSSDE